MSTAYESDAAITLCPATMADARLLFDWVNARDSLAGKEHTDGPISWEEHKRWLSERMKDDGTMIRIVEHDGAPAGQVRLQRRGGLFDVDVYIVPMERRRGLAGAAIAAAVEELERIAPDASVRARVRIDNGQSRRLFERLGFKETGRDGAILTYTCACSASSATP